VAVLATQKCSLDQIVGTNKTVILFAGSNFFALKSFNAKRNKIRESIKKLFLKN